MSFIGIITESKKENEYRLTLKRNLELEGTKNTIILINKKSINNIENVKFDALIIDMNELENNRVFQKILLNAKVLIINSDYEKNLECVKNLKLRVITYGLNSKATFTVSSVEDDVAMISLQRCIKNIKGDIIEPQEMKIDFENTHKNLYISMILAIFTSFFEKN